MKSGHRIVFQVQTENPAPGLHGGCRQEGIIDINSVARVPRSVQGRGSVNDGFIDRRGIELGQEEIGPFLLARTHEEDHLGALKSPRPKLVFTAVSEALEKSKGFLFAA